jgi:hypothetical protein
VLESNVDISVTLFKASLSSASIELFVDGVSLELVPAVLDVLELVAPVEPVPLFCAAKYALNRSVVNVGLMLVNGVSSLPALGCKSALIHFSSEYPLGCPF